MIRIVDDDNVRLDVFISSEWGISRSNAKTVLEKDGAFVNGVFNFLNGNNAEAVNGEADNGEAIAFKLIESP